MIKSIVFLIVVVSTIGVITSGIATGSLGSIFLVGQMSDVQSIIHAAAVGFGLEKITVDNDRVPDSGDEFFINAIDECKFHSAEPITTKTCVICKLLDGSNPPNVLGQGRLDLDTGYTPSTTLLVPITETAPGSNAIQGVHGVEINVCEPPTCPQDPTVTTRVLPSGDVEVTYKQSRFLNDNSYGVNAVGWGTHGHTFLDLVRSDELQFQFRDRNGVVVLDFLSDYITLVPKAIVGSTTGNTLTTPAGVVQTPSHYASLGPNGGDGLLLSGTRAWVKSYDSSLARNLNTNGWFMNGVQTPATKLVADLLLNSPPTNPIGSYNPVSPFGAWDFTDTYIVIISKDAFSANGGFVIGKYSVSFPSIHNSPPKKCPQPTCPPRVPTVTKTVLTGGDVEVTYKQSRNVNDNSYGVNAVGWGTNGHTFNNLVGSDNLEVLFTKSNGDPILRFKLDYLSLKSGTPSGYASRGPDAGGDGSMLFGMRSDIVSWNTSLDKNLNGLGFFAGGTQVVGFGTANLKNNSPPTNPIGSYNPVSPFGAWDFTDTYIVTIKGSAFPGGFTSGGYKVSFPSVHNSPEKKCPVDSKEDDKK